MDQIRGVLLNIKGIDGDICEYLRASGKHFNDIWME